MFDEIWAWDKLVSACFFFCFLRVDSLPLVSEARGDPGRLRLVEEEDGLRVSLCLEGRWDGVLLPFEEVPEWFLVLVLSFSGLTLLFSSAFLRSTSFRRSASVSSDSV